MDTNRIKTLVDCKNEIAVKYGFFDWFNLEQRFSRSVQDFDKLIAVYYDESAELYATYTKNKILDEAYYGMVECHNAWTNVHPSATNDDWKEGYAKCMEEAGSIITKFQNTLTDFSFGTTTVSL